MPDTKILELPEAEAINGSEILNFVQAGANKQDTILNTFHNLEYSEGEFSSLVHGIAETVNIVIKWAKAGDMVFVNIPAFTGTSNSQLLYFDSIPSGILPSAEVDAAAPERFYNGGEYIPGTSSRAVIDPVTERIYIGLGFGWESSGIKGIDSNFMVSYNIG